MSFSCKTDETVVVFASPHKNGDTKKLLELFLKKEKIKNYWMFDCFEQAPAPCNACNACIEKLTCTKKDLREFFERFNRCSRLVIATPIYNGGLPAPLKALVDRSQIYYNARFERNERGIAVPKKAVVLLTCGSAADKTQAVLDVLLPVFSVTSCTFAGSYILRGTDKGKKLPAVEELPSFN